MQLNHNLHRGFVSGDVGDLDGDEGANQRIVSQSGRTAYIQLYDDTASTVVATLSTSNGTWTHLSTSASLTNGHYYRVRLRCSESGYYAYMLGCYLEW